MNFVEKWFNKILHEHKYRTSLMIMSQKVLGVNYTVYNLVLLTRVRKTIVSNSYFQENFKKFRNCRT